MKVKLTSEISSDISQEKINLITSISLWLETFFENKTYGIGVSKIFFGIICVAPSFEEFFKLREPRLQKTNKVHLPNGVIVTSENVLSMDIKLDFEHIQIGTNVEVIENIKNGILDSLNKIERYKTKFEYDKFKDDLKTALSEFNYDKAKEIMSGFLSG